MMRQNSLRRSGSATRFCRSRLASTALKRYRRARLRPSRPPTAELRENQTDQDSLPPYDVLDAVLERLVEREQPLASIVAEGFDREVVARIDRLLNLAEYKRRQAAPGVKVTSRNFGRDRRYPITNKFRDSGKPLPEPDDGLLSRASRGSAEAFEG